MAISIQYPLSFKSSISYCKNIPNNQHLIFQVRIHLKISWILSKSKLSSNLILINSLILLHSLPIYKRSKLINFQISYKLIFKIIGKYISLLLYHLYVLKGPNIHNTRNLMIFLSIQLMEILILQIKQIISMIILIIYQL